MKVLALLFFSFLFTFVGHAIAEDVTPKTEIIRYSAVGDSYTFGEGALPG